MTLCVAYSIIDRTLDNLPPRSWIFSSSC